MIPAVTISKIFSNLEQTGSILQFAVKDGANSAGMTAGSYITGDSLEGKDRLIDEVGAGLIWLLGIRAFNPLVDKTLFKAFKLDPKVDVRNLKDAIREKAIQHGSKDVQDSIKNAFEHQKLFKHLNVAKFLISTGLTVAAYFALTVWRHKHTEENAKKQILLENRMKENKSHFFTGQPSFEAFYNNKEMLRETGHFARNQEISAKVVKQVQHDKRPSFTGIQQILLNPAWNMMFVDGAITTERLTKSRSPQDFIGYTIKEGGFWFFVYFASKKLQNFFENRSKLNIKLDSKVIEGNELKNKLGTKELADDLKAFPKTGDIYDFIHNNPENFIVKTAKTAGLITEKDGKIDTRLFIDTKKIKDIKENLAALDEQFRVSKLGKDAFMKKVVNLKRWCIGKNIGTCILALGVVVPGIMVLARHLNDDKDFEVKKRLEAQMAAQGTL